MYFSVSHDDHHGEAVPARPSGGLEVPPCALHRTAISCPNQDCQTSCGSHLQCVFPILLGPWAVACVRASCQRRLNRAGLPSVESGLTVFWGSIF